VRSPNTLEIITDDMKREKEFYVAAYTDYDIVMDTFKMKVKICTEPILHFPPIGEEFIYDYEYSWLADNPSSYTHSEY
jgi:hypothetical protein